MRLFLIRHAQAGDRQPGNRDLYRPLTGKGRRRALALVDLLGDAGISKVLSSPATRCVETVEPLAEHLGLEIEEQPDLWEGSSTPHVLALLERQGDHAIAACSHGDIIPEVVEALGDLGASIEGRGCEKGSVWILDRDGERWTAAVYLDRSRDQLPDQLRPHR
ncbi:MAG: histidine phosphatase family protein [Acidimicrobiia bacterium]|nr:histidine phosphatase family protein [Acidimicrobiia bacterium]